MKHKYKVGCWVRFYQGGKLVIGIIEYLPKMEAWDREPKYCTDIGGVSESYILEVRYP